jgi:hypothetical protein
MINPCIGSAMVLNNGVSGTPMIDIFLMANGDGIDKPASLICVNTAKAMGH